ncbi:PAS domain-containing hybrid sensor histidine kinase/response regulator [Yeosuana marina]|uniref:PAS domain-containing hybrid sensor histidine kinase/response regulator n=1 Tax=Yeosuana marina TaxID=1565536 RepID=UPI0014201CC6|nr:PAS domain-containing hybrid sensor histidine kinase/response regulator [Yeosuana marina]
MEQLLAEVEFLKEKVVKSERLNESIVKTAVDAIITIEEDGSIRSWNEAAQRIFGYHSNEIVNKSILQIFPNKYINTKVEIDIKRLVKIWLRNKIGQITELSAIRKDGTEFLVEMSASSWESNNQFFITGIFRDITERKQTDFSLQKLSHALNTTKEVVFMTDTDGVFTYINPQFTKMYGYEPHEVIGLKTPRIIKSPKNKRDFNLFWKKLLNKENIASSQYTNIKKDGTIINIEGSADPIINEEGEIIWFLGVHRDITERLKVLDHLKEALAKSKESDCLKSEFLATMSHELRTPLNSIIGLSSLIDESTPKEDVLEFNKIINSSGEHLLDIVEDLFDISLIESGQIEVVKRQVNLQSVLLEVDRLMKTEQDKLDKNHLELNLIVPKEYKNISISTDAIKLKRILKNLLKNALKFTEEGYINYGYNIYQVDDKTMVKFFIEDTGIGIHKDHQELIFEVFRQADGSFGRKHEGMGVGLSTAKKLIILLGGSIWVESLEGNGSSFFFTIPFEQENSLIELNSKLENDNKNTQLKTILIVEDDDSSYEFIKSVLELKNINYKRAENGKIAVEYCNNNSDIDLVLMDINMPVMNGYEASKQIKSVNPKLPIIAQSAYAIFGDKEKALQAGCDDYITKPIVMEDLLTLIYKFLD